MIQLLLITLMTTNMAEKPKLIYVGDPMCSWCYGIAPELEQLKSELKDVLEFELILGGLRPYNKQSMVELKEFLSHHWEDVHKKSKQEFNYAILDDSSITYDTEPPCRANMIVREMAPDKSFEFFHETQAAFYFENKNMHALESYLEILSKLDIDKETFSQKFMSTEAKVRIKEDFKRSAELGVNSFPTILLLHKGEYHTIAQGYSTNEKMQKRIKEILSL